jgi:hypothetical protein
MQMATTIHDPHPADLAGTWQRREPSAPCAARYAARLQLEPGGLYTGQAATPGEFTWWDAGTWRVKDAATLALSVANDEVVDYRFELRGDRLAITDRDGCRVEYQRSA